MNENQLIGNVRNRPTSNQTVPKVDQDQRVKVFAERANPAPEKKFNVNLAGAA